MAEGSGWFSRLKAGLARSSSNLTEKIAGVVAKRRLDEATLEELEEALISADLGVETSALLVKAVAKDRFGREVTDSEVREALAAAIAKELEPVAEPLPHRARFRPQVVLVCGVNGTGKTTTIGKLANQAVGAGLEGGAGGLRHLPRRSGRAARGLGPAQRRAGDPGQGRGGSGRARLRRARARPRRRCGPPDDRHRRPAAEQAGADGRAAARSCAC